MQSAPTTEWEGGATYEPASRLLPPDARRGHRHQPGDKVEVWFEGGGQKSDSFTYDAVSESGHQVLVVAAEDYTGASPVQTPGPHYADDYLDALAANGSAGRRLRRRRAPAAWRRTRSACSATTRPSSGTRATTS